jgi:hypothetical protein
VSKAVRHAVLFGTLAELLAQDQQSESADILAQRGR